MNMTIRGKALALMRDAEGEIQGAMLRVEQNMPEAAAERIHNAEKFLMDARHMLAMAAAGAVEP